MTNVSKQAYHVTKQIEDILDEEFLGENKIKGADLAKVHSLLNQALAILKYGDRRE